MSHRLRDGLALALTTLVIAVPVELMFVTDAQGRPFTVWPIAILAFYCARYASYEVARRLGTTAIDTPLDQLRRRYPERRDQLLAFLIPALVLGMTFFQPNPESGLDWSRLPERFLIGAAAAFLIGVAFGSRTLRQALMPRFLKHFFD